MTKRLPLLPNDEQYVSNKLVPLFTNTPLDKTIDNKIKRIYTHKKLKQVYFL